MLLHRYIGFAFLRSFLFSLVAFVFLIAILEVFSLFRIGSQGQPASHLYYYILLSLPRFITQVLPIALMFGSCFSITQFSLSGELVATYSAGRPLLATLAFALIFSFIAGLTQFFANQFFLTPLNQKANQHKITFLKGSRRLSKKEIRAKNFRGKEGFYYLNYLDKKTKDISGGFSYLQLDENQQLVYFYEADSAKYDVQRQDWLLKQVLIIHFGTNSEISTIENKDELYLALPEKPDFFTKLTYFPNELNLIKLYQELQKHKQQGTNAIEYILELHTRFSFPMICVLLCFIGGVGGSLGNLRSGNSFTHSLFLCTIAILIYYVGFAICKGMAQSGVLSPVWAPWIPIGTYVVVAVRLGKNL